MPVPGKIEPYLLIAAGGFLGACARYGIGESVPGMYGILAINVIGCYLLGVLMYESMFIGAFSPQTRLVYGVGLIGAFTTFSTFSVQAFEAPPAVALAYVAASLLMGLAAVFLGRMTVVLVSARWPWKR